MDCASSLVEACRSLLARSSVRIVFEAKDLLVFVEAAGNLAGRGVGILWVCRLQEDCFSSSLVHAGGQSRRHSQCWHCRLCTGFEPIPSFPWLEP